MRKKIFYFALLLLAFIGNSFYSCLDDKYSNEEIHNKGLKQSARLISSAPPLMTPGGELELSDLQIQSLYELTNSDNIENLRGIAIYTTGNENSSNIDIPNLRAISLYHYKDGKLEHSFFLKNNANNTFEEISELTSFCLGTTSSEISYAIYVSELYKTFNNITVYTAKNWSIYGTKSLEDTNNPESDYEASYDLIEKRAIELGELISLNDIPDEETVYLLNRLAQTEAVCHKGCNINSSGACEVGGGTGTCRGRGLDTTVPSGGGGCRFNFTKSLVDNSLQSNFISEKAYEIRDNFLMNSVFGLKYYEFFYNTSFGECNIDNNDAVSIALLLPKIYTAYDNYFGKDENAIVFNSQLSNEIIEIITSLKLKNSNNKRLCSIFDIVINDIESLSNKTGAEINELLY